MRRDDAAPVVVFDLDGTILSINSFPHWVLFLIIGRLPGLGARRRMLLSLRSLALLLRRKVIGLDHEGFLWLLQTTWRSARHADSTAALDGFEAALLRRVRPNLASVLEQVAAGHIDAVLATAAAEEYAAGLGRRLGFRHVLATSSTRNRGEPGNSGAHKRARVLRFLAEQNWQHRPLILFTDHLDDLPLMRDSTVVYWCGPADAMQRAASEAANARFVFCRDLEVGAIVADQASAGQAAPLRASASS